MLKFISIYIYIPHAKSQRDAPPPSAAPLGLPQRDWEEKALGSLFWEKCAGIGFGCGSVFVGASPSWLAKAMEVNRHNSSKSATTSQQQPIMMDFIRESFTLCLHLSNKEAFMDIMIVAIIQFLHPLWRSGDLSGFCFCLVSRVVS